MKNKKTLYILLPLVAVIWGIIFYRIFSGVSNKNDAPGLKQTFFNDTSVAVAADTFTLIADYRDPFLGRLPSSEKPQIRVASQPRPAPVPLPPTQWPAISYSGLVKNQKSNKLVALVNINNQGSLMAPGQVLNEVTLLKVFKDSIEVQYRGEKKIVRK